MITANDILSIKNEKIILDIFKVKKVASNVYKIIGFNYGEEEVKLTGYADEVAKWLNGFFGLSE
ncbi:hypothetical protein [Bacillus sp. NPDC094106]|uniref:hypothetical protein n=1 Tax=Bacillus sp. NPDC094106 TaxID=3363949 RepID=UPI003802DAE3